MNFSRKFYYRFFIVSLNFFVEKSRQLPAFSFFNKESRVKGCNPFLHGYQGQDLGFQFVNPLLIQLQHQQF